MRQYHTSVLLQETLTHLRIKKGGKYIDGTLGGGGHTKAVIELGGTVLGIDQDQDALDYVQENLKQEIHNSQLVTAKGNFAQIAQIAQSHRFSPIDGILFDFGVSSYQLDDSTRGFSFMTEAPLDMRMDTSLSVTAKDLVNGMKMIELTELFRKYGEERFAKRIAEEIVHARENAPIETTTKLAGIVKKSYPRFVKEKIHPATRIFQALRIAVNDEMRSIENALPEALSILKPGGRLVVISFHSLEDRIVKHTFLQFATDEKGEIITKKPVMAKDEEIAMNNRSRSAKMRVFQKN